MSLRRWKPVAQRRSKVVEGLSRHLGTAGQVTDSHATLGLQAEWQRDCHAALGWRQSGRETHNALGLEAKWRTVTLPLSWRQSDGETVTLPLGCSQNGGETVTLPWGWRQSDGETVTLPWDRRQSDGETVTLPSG